MSVAEKAPAKPLKVGVVGLGDVSPVYLNAVMRSPALQLVAVAGRTDRRAREVAARLGVRALDTPALLSDDDVELVVNLAPAPVHEEINAAAIRGGKHLYCEKPFCFSRQAAEELASLADRHGVLIGSAPDTFLGGAHQAARHALDGGEIGRAVFGRSAVGIAGIETFHPNPEGFYQPGGEHPYNIGPYYIIQWVNLLGPVRAVYASAQSGPPARTIRRGPKAGQSFAVEIPTTMLVVLTFENASVSLLMSLDVIGSRLSGSELFGETGAMTLCDPNFFGGEVRIVKDAGAEQLVSGGDRPFGRPNRREHSGLSVADYRGVGIVDLALCARSGDVPRTGASLIVHVAEVMEAMVQSSRSGDVVAIESRCERPRPLLVESDQTLIQSAPSPFDIDGADGAGAGPDR